MKQAKVENYRARSAFKLIELDDKYHFLKPSSIVVCVRKFMIICTSVCIAHVGHMYMK